MLKQNFLYIFADIVQASISRPCARVSTKRPASPRPQARNEASPATPTPPSFPSPAACATHARRAPPGGAWAPPRLAPGALPPRTPRGRPLPTENRSAIAIPPPPPPPRHRQAPKHRSAGPRHATPRRRWSCACARALGPTRNGLPRPPVHATAHAAVRYSAPVRPCPALPRSRERSLPSPRSSPCYIGSSEQSPASYPNCSPLQSPRADPDFARAVALGF